MYLYIYICTEYLQEIYWYVNYLATGNIWKLWRSIPVLVHQRVCCGLICFRTYNRLSLGISQTETVPLGTGCSRWTGMKFKCKFDKLRHRKLHTTSNCLKRNWDKSNTSFQRRACAATPGYFAWDQGTWQHNALGMQVMCLRQLEQCPLDVLVPRVHFDAQCCAWTRSMLRSHRCKSENE